MNVYREMDLVIKGNEELKGTLTIPEGKGPFTAVLLVSGSGNGDRDGNFSSANLYPNIYRYLAEYLSEIGCITLRTDKRGCGESSGDFISTGMHDLVDDIISCADYLENLPEVKNLVLLGHSEGTILITSANSRKPVDGLIFLAGGGESLKDALVKQRSLAKEELLATKGLKGRLFRLLRVDRKIDKQADRLNKKIMSTDSPVIKYQMQKINAKWFRQHYQYNVFDDLAKVSCPCLGINGSKDIQVTPEKVHNLSNYVKGPVDTYVIENMDHLLKETGECASILNPTRDYKINQEKPMHPELKSRLLDWLGSQGLLG